MFNLEQLPTQQVRGREKKSVCACFLFVCGRLISVCLAAGQGLTSLAPAADPQFVGLGHDDMWKPKSPPPRPPALLPLPTSPVLCSPTPPPQTQLLIISE